jgi:hypothetical protein
VDATFPGPPCPHPVFTCRPLRTGKSPGSDPPDVLPFAHVSLWCAPSADRADDRDLLTPYTETLRASRALARVFANPLCAMLGGGSDPSCYESHGSSGGGSEWGPFLAHEGDVLEHADAPPCLLVCVSLLKHSRARVRHDEAGIHSVPPSPGARRPSCPRTLKRPSSGGMHPHPGTISPMSVPRGRDASRPVAGASPRGVSPMPAGMSGVGGATLDMGLVHIQDLDAMQVKMHFGCVDVSSVCACGAPCCTESMRQVARLRACTASNAPTQPYKRFATC